MPRNKQPKPTATTTLKRRGRKPGQFPGAVVGEDASKPLPPGTSRQIAQNNKYYSDIEFLIWRSINGSKW